MPRHTREQVADAAVAVVEASGFGALSLRSVARQLGVSPMSLYTYVDGTEEFEALVVDRLIDGAVRDLTWPSAWRDVLHLLAAKLDELVTEHPAMVDAFGRGIVHGEASVRVSSAIGDRLLADGLSPEQVVRAYLGVHALVLGCAVLRAGVPDPPVAVLVDALLDGIAPA